jgi:hypothetical protein
MFLLQQSASFRVWTSRALMVYFRRALLFLVVNPRQNTNHQYFLSQQQQQQQKVCFSDAEDDEEILMISDKKELVESTLDRIQISQSKHHLLNEYVCTEVSQGLNNSRSKSIEKSSMIFDSVQPAGTEQFESSAYNVYQGSKTFAIETVNNIEIDENKLSNDSVDQYQTKTSHHNRINPMLSSPVSRLNEKKKKKCHISICSLVHLAMHYSLRLVRLTIKLRHVNCLLNVHQLPFKKISLHRPRMKMIFMKNIKIHFHIFFIKQKAFRQFVKKINYTLCLCLNQIPQSLLFVHSIEILSIIQCLPIIFAFD